MADDTALIAALRARAARDAEAFRSESRDVAPSEQWVENRYTAALPLAASDSGFDPGPDPHPDLFAAYTEELSRSLGIPAPRED